MSKDYYDGPDSSWYEPPDPYCECDNCEWCHEAYDHHWYDWQVPIEEWDCLSCQQQFESGLADSIVTGQCEIHDKNKGTSCQMCQQLAFSNAKVDKAIDTDINVSMEDKFNEN